MKVIIAEKKSAADAIAAAVKANSKKDGYYENSEYQVTWSYGHLVGLAMPEDYDPELKKWSKESLPIIPDRFQLKVKDDPGIRKQFKICKELFQSADEIICATDSDREGDLIFHYIYSLSGVRKPYKRVLPNDLTENALLKVLGKKIDPRNNIIASAQARSQADWLIGINATRAITLASNTKITIGRVQTPTLGLVCQRYLDNQNFTPTPYYPVTLTLKKDDIEFKAKIKEPPTEKVLAQNITSEIGDTTCTFSEKKQKKEKQPLPYYLSTLQIDAANKLDLDAQKTLDIAQSLYEKHRITTYPRTDSGYLTSELYNEVPQLLKDVFSLYPDKQLSSIIDIDNLPKNCINDSKAPNHHGIIPTSNLNVYSNLSDIERKVFDLIALRFSAAFGPECIKDKTRYEFLNNTNTYVTTGSVTIEPGWRSILKDNDSQEEKESQEDDQSNLPNIAEGNQVETLSATFEEKLTKPPALLTIATLIQLMKSCGSKLSDKELRKAMQDNDLRSGGLATEATRAGIIENLFNVGLITKQKKNVIPTEMGLSLFDQIKNLDIAKPELTASWEMMLDQISQGSKSLEEFISEIENYTKKVTIDLLTAGLKVDTDNLKLTCPKCKKGRIIEGKKGFGCSQWKEGCNFVIWKETGSKKLSLSQITDLIEKGITKEIKGFKNKEGKTFDAKLKLDDEFKVTYDFPEKDQTKYNCPSCSKQAIKINKGGAFCDQCDFKIWRKKSEKQLTDTTLIQLLEKGSTGIVKGFKSKQGKSFEAKLKFDKDKLVFEFPKK